MQIAAQPVAASLAGAVTLPPAAMGPAGNISGSLAGSDLATRFQQALAGAASAAGFSAPAKTASAAATLAGKTSGHEGSAAKSGDKKTASGTDGAASGSALQGMLPAVMPQLPMLPVSVPQAISGTTEEQGSAEGGALLASGDTASAPVQTGGAGVVSYLPAVGSPAAGWNAVTPQPVQTPAGVLSGAVETQSHTDGHTASNTSVQTSGQTTGDTGNQPGVAVPTTAVVNSPLPDAVLPQPVTPRVPGSPVTAQPVSTGGDSGVTRQLPRTPKSGEAAQGSTDTTAPAQDAEAAAAPDAVSTPVATAADPAQSQALLQAMPAMQPSAAPSVGGTAAQSSRMSGVAGAKAATATQTQATAASSTTAKDRPELSPRRKGDAATQDDADSSAGAKPFASALKAAAPVTAPAVSGQAGTNEGATAQTLAAAPATPAATQAQQPAAETAAPGTPQPAAQPSSFPAESGTPLPGVSSAQLLQTAHGSEMRVGLQSEFGNISISTTLGHQALSAQISLDHAALGHALAAHLPSIEEKLGAAYGVPARVEVQSGTGSREGSYSDSGSHSAYDTPQGDGRRERQASSTSNFTYGAAASTAGSASTHSVPVTPAVASGSSRLDVLI